MEFPESVIEVVLRCHFKKRQSLQSGISSPMSCMEDFSWPILEVMAKSVPASKMPVATTGFSSSVFDLEIRALTGTAEQTPAVQIMVWVTAVSDEDGEKDSLSDAEDGEKDSLSDAEDGERDTLSDSEGVNVVNEGDTVAAGLGSIKVVVPGVAVAVGMVNREHPVAASQLVVDVVISTIRMVGSGRGAPASAGPAGARTVPADTSDAVGQYPSRSGSHRISITAGVDPVSVAAGAK